MRILYWFSWIPTAPFWAAGWVLFGAAWVVTWVGNLIHDLTTDRLYWAIQRREQKRAEGGK